MALWNERAAGSPPYTLTLTGHGDSMTLTGGALRTYVQRLALLIEAGQAGQIVRWTRCGINGASYNYAWVSAGYPYTLTQDAPLRADPNIPGLPSWLVVLAGTNGIVIGGHSAATEYADFQTYIAARIAAGWAANRIIVNTMLPRTGLSEVTRGSFNTSVVSGAVTYGYRLARLDLNPNIGAAGQDLDTTYFLDGTHPTDAGQAIIATIQYNIMYP